MNHLVQYKNCMNQLSFVGFGAKDYDFLMALCSCMRNQGNKEITLSFFELRKLAGYDAHKDSKIFERDLKRMNHKLAQIVCEFDTGAESIMFVLFPTFKINRKKSVLTISVNDQFQFILNNITNMFTQFELQEFVGLGSKYSKCLYRLLKQFKNTGVYFVELSKFKELMDIPKTYSNNIITRDIVNPSVNELKQYFKNLYCKVQYEKKRGNPIKGYMFVFDSGTTYERTLYKQNERNSFFRTSDRNIDYDEIAKRKIEKHMCNELYVS